MAELSRRSFLVRSSGALAAVGAIAAVPSGLAHAADASDRTPVLTEAELASVESMVIHVADPGTGELSVMTGTHEFRVRNRRLVAQLVRLVRA